MKKLVNRIAIVLVVCALTGITALAEVKSKRVIFIRDLTINGTLVKKGTYKMKFDDQTGELTIMNGKKVVAKTTARLEKLNVKATQTLIGSNSQGGSNVLRSITFRGEQESIILTDSRGEAVNGQ